MTLKGFRDAAEAVRDARRALDAARDAGLDTTAAAHRLTEARRRLRREVASERDRPGQHGSFHRVLVAVSDGAESRAAVQAAADIAAETGAPLAIVHVMPPIADTLPELMYAAVEARTIALRAGRDILERARSLVPDGLGLKQFLREGCVTDEILTVAHAWEADLIVVGTRGRGRLAELLMGSTAEAVVRAAACPVLVVKTRHADATTTRTSEDAAGSTHRQEHDWAAI